jgi:hypothetical protein
MKLWVNLAAVIPASVALMTALPQSGSASDKATRPMLKSPDTGQPPANRSN